MKIVKCVVSKIYLCLPKFVLLCYILKSYEYVLLPTVIGFFLFIFQEKVNTQTLSTNAPVQCMDINFEQLIVGTKVGTILSYTIKVKMI